MNCFDFQNRTSDYLDGLLSDLDAERVKTHLTSCEDCGARLERFRNILERITNSPKSAPPAMIGKTPRNFTLHPRGMARSGKRVWKSIPWYLRTTIEGVSVVLLVLAAVSTGPKLRLLYERSIERSMTEFNETFNDPLVASAELPPLTRGSSSAAAAPETAAGEDEFLDDAEAPTSEDIDGGSNADAQLAAGDVRVGSAEIWRFNMKTDSPHEVRARVVQILTELNVPAATPGLGGIEAPGGIQFDLLVPQTVVSGLKKQLEKIAPRAPANSAVGETFAWYKNKSRRPIPSGKTRVVIWLSQM